MKSIILILLVSLLAVPVMAKNSEFEQVISTQGVNIDESIVKSKPSAEEKNEQREFQSRSKKYIRYQKDLKRQNLKKTAKEKELEYLEQRLEHKKNKMETLFQNSEKGELE